MKVKNVKSLISFYIIISAFLIAGSGCGGAASSSSLSLTFPVGGDGGLSGTSDGIDDPSQFYVGILKDSTTIAHVRSSAAFNTKCSIAKTAANSDTICYVDMPEGDVFMKGVTLQYNVPAGMCRYLKRSTYWYYDHEVGIGPSSLDIAIVKNASGDTTSYTCNIDGAGVGPCGGAREISVNQVSNQPTCIYDSTGNGGPNCCMGNYRLSITTTTGAGSPLTQITNPSWGGNYKSCIGGAGKTNWENYSKSGLPVAVVESAVSGVLGNYKVSSPISTTNGSSTLPVSNFYENLGHTHDGFVLARSTTKPYFVDPVDDRSGSAIISGQDSYSFECYGEAFELKHRINVYVREWDTYPDFLNYVASAGVTYIPNRVGNEGAGCVGVAGPCDDFFAADDFLGFLGGLYDTTIGNVNNRRMFFPYLNED